MTDDPKGERVSIPRLRPKRQPPVIDAEARDVTPRTEETVSQEDPPLRKKETANATPEGASPEHAKREETKRKAGFDVPPPATKRFDFASALPALAVAAVCGMSAGLFGSWLFSASAPPVTDTSAINSTIAQLSSRLSQQETKPQAAIDLSPLNERSAKLETATGELRGQLEEVRKLIEAQSKTPVPALTEIAAVNRKLAQIEEEVGALAALPKPEPQPKRDTQSAEVVALGALRDTVAAGLPFINELSAVRGLLKERAASLSPLETFSKDGVPTVAVLAKRFEPVAARLLNPPPPADSGVLTRLWSNAGKLVDVRPVGEPQGSDTGAIVARMEAKLARGELAGALDETKLLSAPSREVAKDWIAVAEQKLAAEASIKTLISAALAAISAEQLKQ